MIVDDDDGSSVGGPEPRVVSGTGYSRDDKKRRGLNAPVVLVFVSFLVLAVTTRIATDWTMDTIQSAGVGVDTDTSGGVGVGVVEERILMGGNDNDKKGL